MEDRNEEENISEVQDVEMSRTEKEEFVIDLDGVEDYEVLDRSDKKIKFGNLYKDQKTIVIFIRNFLCFMYREYVEDLVKINEDDFKESGVKLILIGCADTKFLDAYIKDTKLKFPIYVDPERKLYKMIGLLDKPRKTVMCRDSKHVKSGKVVGLMKMVWKTMTSGYQELQGDMEQQGGAFILGPGNDVHFYHIDLVSNDHCPINDLMEKCGLPFINFPNDKRPENI